jgi:hypothetical protein
LRGSSTFGERHDGASRQGRFRVKVWRGQRIVRLVSRLDNNFFSFVHLVSSASAHFENLLLDIVINKLRHLSNVNLFCNLKARVAREPASKLTTAEKPCPASPESLMPQGLQKSAHRPEIERYSA